MALNFCLIPLPKHIKNLTLKPKLHAGVAMDARSPHLQHPYTPTLYARTNQVKQKEGMETQMDGLAFLTFGCLVGAFAGCLLRREMQVSSIHHPPPQPSTIKPSPHTHLCVFQMAPGGSTCEKLCAALHAPPQHSPSAPDMRQATW